MGAEGATRERADRFELRVVSFAREAEDIVSVALARPDGGELPAFTAGAHIDVHFANGLTRQYSLCNPPAERSRYVVAVLREPSSRGGSRAMHDGAGMRSPSRGRATIFHSRGLKRISTSCSPAASASPP